MPIILPVALDEEEFIAAFTYMQGEKSKMKKTDKMLAQ